MKLKTIRLHNFQAHRDTKIDVSDGITIIAGESNNGKTSIMRAVQWVLTNKPTGLGFVSSWAKYITKGGTVSMKPDEMCEVELVLSEETEHSIIRRRTGTSNSYIIDGKELSAIGKDVPPEVLDLLNMSDVNAQSQDDPYFLITETGGSIASRLNELVHLETIDKGFSIANERKRMAMTQVKLADQESLAANVKLDAISFAPQLAEDSKVIVKMNDMQLERERALRDINELCQKLDAVERGLEALPFLGNIDSQIGMASDLMSEMKERSRLVLKAEDLMASISSASHKLSAMPDIAEDADIDAISRLLDRQADARDRLAAMNSLYLDIQAVSSRLSKLAQGIEDSDISLCKDLLNRMQEIERDKSKMNDMARDMANAARLMSHIDAEIAENMKDMPDTCPLCGSPMSKEGNHEHSR